jgi:hypothetical protein
MKKFCLLIAAILFTGGCVFNFMPPWMSELEKLSLKYGNGNVDYDISSWSFQTVATYNNLEVYPYQVKFQVDSQGRPHLAYKADSDLLIKYFNGSWTEYAQDNPDFSGIGFYEFDFVLDKTDRALVTFTIEEYVGPDWIYYLNFSYNNGASNNVWETDTLWNSEQNIYDSTVRIGQNNTPYLVGRDNDKIYLWTNPESNPSPKDFETTDYYPSLQTAVIDGNNNMYLLNPDYWDGDNSSIALFKINLNDETPGINLQTTIEKEGGGTGEKGIYISLRGNNPYVSFIDEIWDGTNDYQKISISSPLSADSGIEQFDEIDFEWIYDFALSFNSKGNAFLFIVDNVWVEDGGEYYCYGHLHTRYYSDADGWIPLNGIQYSATIERISVVMHNDMPYICVLLYDNTADNYNIKILKFAP